MYSIVDFEKQLVKVVNKNFEGLTKWSSEVSVALSRPSSMESCESFLKQIELWEFNYKFRGKITKNYLLKLSILKWFLPKEALCVINSLIDDNIKKFHLDEDGDFNLYHYNRAECLIYLYEKYKFRRNEFFGWLLQEETIKVHNSIVKISPARFEEKLPRSFWKKKRLAKVPQRKRGYHDHGHLGSDFSKTIKDQADDFTITEIVLQNLQRKQEISDTIAFIRGGIQ